MALFVFTTQKDFSAQLILKEAQKKSLDCFIYFYPDFIFKKDILYHKSKSFVSVNKKDKIVLRDPYQDGNYSLALGKILKRFYKQILLDKECLRKHPRYEDKLFQARFFQKNNLYIPETYFGTEVRKISKFPVVAKKRISSRGKDNSLLRNSQELNAFYKRHNARNYIAQTYKKATGDYRILILKGKILGIVSRQVKLRRDKSIKVKVTQAFVKLPKKVTNDSLKITKKLGADFVGIDVLFSQKKYYFLEANLSPQFKGFSRVTGVNVAQKIINLFF